MFYAGKNNTMIYVLLIPIKPKLKPKLKLLVALCLTTILLRTV